MIGSLGLVGTALCVGSITLSAGCADGRPRATQGIAPLDAVQMRSNALAHAGQSQFWSSRTAGVELDDAQMLRGMHC